MMKRYKLLKADSPEAKDAIAELLEGDTVLVEVVFPRMGTSSDWYLCDDEEDFLKILEGLASGVEVYINSVWDLTNEKGTTIAIKI